MNFYSIFKVSQFELKCTTCCVQRKYANYYSWRHKVCKTFKPSKHLRGISEEGKIFVTGGPLLTSYKTLPWKALSTCLYFQKTKSERHIVSDLFPGYTGPTAKRRMRPCCSLQFEQSFYRRLSREPLQCVVPENIHTPPPPHGGSRNFLGVGDLKETNFQRGGGFMKSFSFQRVWNAIK